MVLLQPQPPHSFLWGHLKVMGEAAALLPPNTHPQAYITSIAQKYDLKDIFYIDLWPIADPQVVIFNPDLMTYVTVTKPLAMHPMADDFLGPIVGRGNVATSNGPVWKKVHNAMAPAFSWSAIRNTTGIIVEEGMHFRRTLDRLAQSGEAFSMEEKAAELIFDVIARLVFNFPLHAQTQKSSYLDNLREMVHLAETLIVLQSLKERITTHSESVGGPVDIAVITKAEGLVWIKRKHYFEADRNLPYVMRQRAMYGEKS